MIVMRCSSHKARKRLFAAIGRHPAGVYSFYSPSVYGCYEITEDELPKAQLVNGVTKARTPRDGWRACWS